MTRSSSPGAIRFVCSDPHHIDEPGARRPYGTLRPVWRDGEVTGLAWSGPNPEPTDQVSTSGISLAWPGLKSALPQKSRRRDDGSAVWRFRCTCGRDPQAPEPELARIVRDLHAVFGHVEIDLVRLDRR